MYFKFALAISLLCCSIGTTKAQSNIRGKVTDSLNRPIINATITLKSNNVILKFTKTNESGNYTFILEKDFPLTSLVIEAKSLGYSPINVNLNTNERVVYNFKLKEAVIDLATVNVKHKPIIIRRGDTLNYRTADFANINDRSIGDVLKKMPGIKVDDNGKISYNNQDISNLYIDGDNLLDDKYNIGTKSIPYKAVTKIQVIDNDQPIKMLQRNNLSTDVAINLVIDKAAKLKAMGNASLGAGLPSRYNENIDLILLKQRFKFLNNVSLNNTGIDLSDDVFSHNNASYLNRGENNSLSFQVNTGVGIPPYLPKSRYLFNKSGILNTNNLYKLSVEKLLKTNIYYLYDFRDQNTSYTTRIDLPNEKIRYEEDQSNQAKNQSLYTQLNYIDNAINHYVNNNLTLDYSPNHNKSGINGQLFSFTQQLDQKRFNVINSLKYLQILKSGRILNINSYLEKTDQTELLNVFPGINQIVLNSGLVYEQLDQHISIPGLFTNNRITYSAKKNHLTTSYQAGFTYQYVDYDTHLKKLQNNKTITLANNGLNKINWNQAKLYVNPGLDYKTDWLRISLRAPLSLNLLNYTVDTDVDYKRIFVNPSVDIEYKFSQEFKLNASYTFTENMGTVEDIYSGIILKNYRNLVSNNISLPFNQTHVASFALALQNTIHMLFANLKVTYAYSLFDNITDNMISNSTQIRKAVPFENNTNAFTISSTFGKYFTALNSNLSFDAQFRRSNGQQLQNNSLFPYRNDNFSLGINLNSKITSTINTNYRSSYIELKNSTSFSGNDFKLNQWRQFANVNTTFLKRITLGFNLNHFFVQQSNQQNLNYLFTDVHLKYKWLKIKTDFELGLNNLNNVKTFSTYFININSFTSANYNIPGRNVLLRAVFAFN